MTNAELDKAITDSAKWLLKADDLDWSRKNPCKDCPFIKTSPYHNGVAGSIPGLMNYVDAGIAAHTCHATDNRDDVDGPKNWKGKTQACAVFTMMLLRTGKGKDLQMPLLKAAEQGKIDLADMIKRARESKIVYTISGLLTFYAEEVSRRVIRKTKKKRMGL